jgi:phage terminase small subunit
MADLSDKPLSPQQLRFVEEYLVDPSSITAAAKRAGYAISSAPQAGSRLMADPRIKRAIQIAQDKRAEAIGISKERVLQELAKIAFAEVGELVSLNGDDESVDFSKLKGSAAEVSVTATSAGGRKAKAVSIKSVKQSDKINALVKIGQHLGVFKEQEVQVNLSLDSLIKDSYKTEDDKDEADQYLTEEEEALFLDPEAPTG